MTQNKKQVLGITGGVGAGKSTILEYLRSRHGAEVLECDRIAQKLQQPGGACYALMRALLPGACVLENGEFDRGKVAEVVFRDPQMLTRLNNIVHPKVKEYVSDVIRQEKGKRLVVVEAALLLDGGYRDLCDEIWYVYASEESRRARLEKSRGYTRERTDRIIAAQRSDESFRRLCDLTIDNSSADLKKTFELIDKGLTDHGFLYDCQRQLR